MSEEKNPFADSDGLPKDGQSAEFYKWEKEKAKERLDKLPPAEQKQVIEAEAALNKRMAS